MPAKCDTPGKRPLANIVWCLSRDTVLTAGLRRRFWSGPASAAHLGDHGPEGTRRHLPAPVIPERQGQPVAAAPWHPVTSRIRRRPAPNLHHILGRHQSALPGGAVDRSDEPQNSCGGSFTLVVIDVDARNGHLRRDIQTALRRSNLSLALRRRGRAPGRGQAVREGSGARRRSLDLARVTMANREPRYWLIP